MSTPVPNPGLRNQAGARTTLRILGPLVLLAGLALLVIALLDLFATMGTFESPTRFWMLFAAMPLLFVGGTMTLWGYAGTASRYASGETMPVLKDSAAYLSDGHGVAGVGRTVDDDSPAVGTSAGPYCRGCGARNDAEARFCDSCGQSLA